MEFYYSNHKVGNINISPTTTIKQLKEYIEIFAREIYTITLTFNNGEQLAPIVWNTNTYDNNDFQAQAHLIKGGRIDINPNIPNPNVNPNINVIELPAVGTVNRKIFYVPQNLNNNPQQEINLGYLPMSVGEWGFFDEEEADNEEYEELTPDEIVIPRTTVKIIYNYPFNREYIFTHRTINPQGFTRKEISEQIMRQYALMYQDMDRYGVWGHGIDDLMLHTLYNRGNGVYSIGIDS